MDMHNLNCFVVLAEYLNFTKASTMLHISQPALSKIIFSLEEEIGFPLFIRSRRSVTLTEGGKEFLQGTRRLLSQYNYLVNNARSVSDERGGFVRIGVLGYSVFAWFPKLIETFRRRQPKVGIHILTGSQGDLLDAVRIGRIDVAFVTENTAGLMDEFEHVVAHEDKLLLVLHEDSPFAERAPVELSLLKDETFLLYSRNISFTRPTYFGDNILLRICAEKNMSPKVIFVDTVIDIPLLVSCRMGIAILGEALRDFAPPNVRFVEIADLSYGLTQFAVYNHESDNPGVLTFLDFIREYCPRCDGGA